MTRTFEDKPALRTRVPILLGLAGPSNSGKTCSALRIASGMQKIVGGDIYVIDTESKRSLHYAGKQFKFRHIEFGAPFSPLDYLAAIEHCVKKGASSVIVDSMSHEHEGPGGVLDMHEQEAQRIAKAWNCSLDKAQFAAWAKPKADRQRLINTILQLGVNTIFCFRAKEKVKPNPDKASKERLLELGWMPICGDNLIFEMTASLLLPAGSKGRPVLRSSMQGEQQWIKIPRQCEGMFGGQLSEKTGEALALWGEGKTDTPVISDSPTELPSDQASEHSTDPPAQQTREPGEG
jgi:hypothetical protein